MNIQHPSASDPNYEYLPPRTIIPDDPAYGSYSEPGFGLPQLLLIVRRNLLMILAVVAVAVAGGLVVTILTTPRYTAGATVQINQSTDRILDQQDVQPIDAIQDADRFLQTQVDIIKSRAMAQRVAQRLDLYNKPGFFEQMGGKTPADDGKPGYAARRHNAVLGLLSANLTVDLPHTSRVALISFESPTPQLAALIANTFADEYIKSNLERRFDSTSYARDFLARQLADAKRKLEDSEKQLNDYARSAQLIHTQSAGDNGQGSSAAGTSTSITTSSLVQMNQAANEARTLRIAAEEKWNAIRNVPALSIPDVLSNAAFQQLLAQRAAADAELQTELTKHLDSHPNVVLLKARVAEIDRQSKALAQGIRDSIKHQYESARLREQELETQVVQFKNDTLNEQDRSVRYNILAREADTNRTLYEGLLQRYKEISAASGITVNNLSIIDQADTPQAPTSPKLFLNLAVALLLGLTLAGGLVLLREQIDDLVRSPDDVENKLGLRLLGVIPAVREDQSIPQLALDQRSSIAESYSALRTSLLYSSPSGLPKVLLFTSSEAGEGKSSSAYALAVSLARLGKRVCLIEVDLRRPLMSTTLKMNSQPDSGMSRLLTSDDDVRSSIQTTEVPNLSVIFAGAAPPGPSELLSNPRMLEVLAHLRELFDVLILDGPPVLGLADAPILASIADATIYVVEAKRPHRGAAKVALRRLRAARGNVLGALLTKFDADKAGGGYGYYGHSYYSYGNRAQDA